MRLLVCFNFQLKRYHLVYSYGHNFSDSVEVETRSMVLVMFSFFLCIGTEDLYRISRPGDSKR